MIVCMCRNVSDRAVSAALDAGATDLAQVAHATGGAGSGCGCCAGAIEAMLANRAPCANPPCAGCPRGASAPAA